MSHVEDKTTTTTTTPSPEPIREMSDTPEAPQPQPASPPASASTPEPPAATATVASEPEEPADAKSTTPTNAKKKNKRSTRAKARNRAQAAEQEYMERVKEQQRVQAAEQRVEQRLRYLFAIVHQSMRAQQIQDNPMLGEITEDEWEQYCQVELFDLMKPGFKQDLESMAQTEVNQSDDEPTRRATLKKITEARVRLRYVGNVSKRLKAAVDQLGESYKLWRTMHEHLRYLIWFREEDEESHAHTRKTWLADQAERKEMKESGGGVEDKEHSFRWVVAVPSEADLRKFETVMADRVRRSAFLAQYTPMRVEPQCTSAVLALQSLLDSQARVDKEIRRIKASVFSCEVQPMTPEFIHQRMQSFCMLSIPIGAYPTATLASLRGELNKVLLSLCTTSIVEAVQKAYRAKAVEYLNTVEDLQMDKLKRSEMIERGAMAFANALNDGKM